MNKKMLLIVITVAVLMVGPAYASGGSGESLPRTNVSVWFNHCGESNFLTSA